MIMMENIAKVIFDFLKGQDNCGYKIRNLNFCCVFNEKEIKILSFTIEDNQCLMKLHQIIKFNRNLKLLKRLEYNEYGSCIGSKLSNNNFIQENDGLKIYILYENELIILSKNGNYFQIDSLIKCGKNIKSYYAFHKFKNKIMILAKNDKEKMIICEINLINYKIKYEPIDIDGYYSTYYNCIFLNRYILFSSNTNILFFDLNKKEFIANISFNNLECIEHFYKIENVFIIERREKIQYDERIIYEFWRIENNKIEYLNKIKDFE